MTTTEEAPTMAPPLDGASMPPGVLVLAFAVPPDVSPQVRVLLLATLMVARRHMGDAAHDVLTQALRDGLAHDPFVANGEEITAAVMMQAVLNLAPDDRRAVEQVVARIGGRKRTASAVNMGVPQ